MGKIAKTRRNYYLEDTVVSSATEKLENEKIPSLSFLINKLLDMYNKGKVSIFK